MFPRKTSGMRWWEKFERRETLKRRSNRILTNLTSRQSEWITHVLSISCTFADVNVEDTRWN